MRSLQARITTVFVVAMAIVVGLATVLTFITLDRPRFDRMIEPTVAEMSFAIEVLNNRDALGPDFLATTTIGLRDEPASGENLAPLAELLAGALRRHGIEREVKVSRPPNTPWPLASVAVGERGGWLIMPMPIPPPPSAWPIVGRWMLIVAIGTTIVAIWSVYRLTRPLTQLRRAIDGTPADALPELQETGPPEVRATAKAINHLSERLHAALQSKMRLVAAAGHDLRTPMTRMRLRAEFLEPRDRDAWLRDLDELERIADSAIQLVRTGTDSRVMQSVALDELAADIVGELRSQELRVELGTVEPVTAWVDRLATTRALRNLVINGATHGNHATVHVWRTPDAACLSIEDDGPGIPDELMQRVFEPFFRTDPARSASVPGAGLGLAIAKEIIDRNAGRIILTNRLTGGLRQEIRLPLGEETDDAPPPLLAAPAWAGHPGMDSFDTGR